MCTVDELYVLPEHRGSGLATALLQRLVGADESLWPAGAVALALEVSPRNERARSPLRAVSIRVRKPRDAAGHSKVR